jgi:hypothetical protein
MTSRALQSALAPVANFRNKIINGGFDVWQRGTSFTRSGDVGPYFMADRWFGSMTGGGMNESITQEFYASALRGDGAMLRKYWTSTNAGGQSRIIQIVDTVGTISPLAGKTVTLSFRYRNPNGAAQQNGSFFVNVRHDTIANPSISSSACSTTPAESLGLTTLPQTLVFTGGQAWVEPLLKFSVTFTVPADARRLMLIFQWTGNTVANALLDLAAVQLEEGPIATPFEQRPVGLELLMCQRYYELGAGKVRSGVGSTAAGTVQYMFIPFKVQKRVTPTVTASGVYSVGPTDVSNIGFELRRNQDPPDINSFTADAEL